ncbi:hypothetical protein HC358_01535 [Wolbachia pipientis]|uniref:Uncharacterized protein n=1 Tax=Wolbachia pipientis TaxID=955 RepID=A0A7G5C9C1_WOLPI|nr:hypothetical protein [Wolbachia pipientis]QMV45805.1 hypothetical protein HC358_01535 [Wolbachia pipientis]
MHITEKDSEGSYSTEYNKNIDESDGEDILNISRETPRSDLDFINDLINDHMDELEFENFSGTINRVQPCVTIYQQVDESMQESTLYVFWKREWQQINILNSNETTAARAIRESLELIALREDKKILFGMLYNVFSKNISLIDLLVRNLYFLKAQELSACEKHQLDILSSKISDLVLTGTYVSEESLQFLPPDLIEKRNDYLSDLRACPQTSKFKNIPSAT